MIRYSLTVILSDPSRKIYRFASAACHSPDNILKSQVSAALSPANT
jgi:hypothetical protein